MATNYDGLTRNPWPGTWSPGGNHPIILDTEIRGGLRLVTGVVNDRLTDIPGQRLQDGMIAYLAENYTLNDIEYLGQQYYQYKLLPDQSRNQATGILPNTAANWQILTFGGGSGDGFTGSQGVVGFTGSQGIIGFTGSRGDTGFTGFIGSQGDQGVIGFTGSQGAGFTGSQGDIGFTGSQGNVGFTGSQGVRGFAGSRGDTGFTGSIGFTGSKGDTGFVGSQGIPGTGLKIMGSAVSTAELPVSYAGDIGDGYLTADNGHLHIWLGNSWLDVGPVRGPQGFTGSGGGGGGISFGNYDGGEPDSIYGGITPLDAGGVI